MSRNSIRSILVLLKLSFRLVWWVRVHVLPRSSDYELLLTRERWHYAHNTYLTRYCAAVITFPVLYYESIIFTCIWFIHRWIVTSYARYRHLTYYSGGEFFFLNFLVNERSVITYITWVILMQRFNYLAEICDFMHWPKYLI